jgi:hypothetical protein
MIPPIFVELGVVPSAYGPSSRHNLLSLQLALLAFSVFRATLIFRQADVSVFPAGQMPELVVGKA